MRRNYLKNILKGSEEMYLTDEEKAILSGARGEAAKLAMETLIKIGEINGAEKLSLIHILNGSQRRTYIVRYAGDHFLSADFLLPYSVGRLLEPEGCLLYTSRCV